MVERSLPAPEVRGSNPVIGKIYIEWLLSNGIEKTKIKNKEAENGPFFIKRHRTLVLLICFKAIRFLP